MAKEARRRVSGDLSSQLMQLRDRRRRKASGRREHPQHRVLTDTHQDIDTDRAPHLPRSERIHIAVTHGRELDVAHLDRGTHAATKPCPE